MTAIRIKKVGDPSGNSFLRMNTILNHYYPWFLNFIKRIRKITIRNIKCDLNNTGIIWFMVTKLNVKGEKYYFLSLDIFIYI